MALLLNEDFDSLATTGTSNTWLDDTTIPGWYSNRTTYLASTGTSTTGGLYSFGDSSDRALGGIGSNATGTIFWGTRIVNTTGSTITDLTISYAGEQWRNGGNTTAHRLDFSYQVGATGLTSGTWVDFDPLDFVGPIASSTAGALNGNATANRTSLSSTLNGLSIAPGESVWLRWADANDAGNDHGLAIDDVVVEAGMASITPAIILTESGGSTDVNEEGETTDTYTIALSTAPTAPVSIDITADAQTQISLDGVNFFSSRTLVLSDTTAATVTVRAVNDNVQEASPHIGLITHIVSTTDPDYTSLTVPNLTVNVLDNDVALSITKIHDIQGTGNTFNPAFGGTRTIEAIVVGDFQTNGSVANLRGFYVQEEDADADDNPLTSEGLFIFDDAFGLDVNVGDKVQVTGTVAEFTSGTSSLTQLRSLTNVTVVSTDNPLPTAVTLNFPVTSPAGLEAFEGMRVTIPDTLTVTEHFQLGRFGQVVLSSDGSSNQAGTDGRLEQFTQFNAPSVSGYSTYLQEIAKRRIVLDDGQTIQNPDPIVYGRGGNPLSSSNTLRGGDTVTGLSGILDDRFGASNLGNYRIQAVAPVDFQPTNPRTEVPDVGGSLKVASFNVLNYFNGDGMGGGFPTSRGAETVLEFTRQRDKTIAAIHGLDADVVGLIEIENDGYGSTSAIQDLVNGLNAIAGAGTYAFIDPGTPNLGTDEIAVGFIYKPGKVTPVGDAATVANGFGQAAFDGNNRKPLAQTFQENATGALFTPVINHFKSKGSSSGGPGDADAGDGQGLSNGTRTRASQDLAAWLATNPTGINDPDYMILGDLNAYAKEDPVTTLEAAGYTNLVDNTSYSFVFDGQWGSLDHALATSSLVSQVTGAAKWHINADEPNVLDYNTNFKSAGQIANLYAPDAFRSSDHDPVLVGLDLDTPSLNVINGTRFADNLVGTIGNDEINGNNGDDIIDGGFGNDIIEGGRGGDIIRGGFGNDILAADRIDRFNDFDGTISELYGEAGNDTIYGGNKADLIDGGTGNDILFGKGDDDQMFGGDGDDLLNGGLGNDLLNGGAGFDTADYSDLAFSGVFATVAGLDVNLTTGIAKHSSANRALGWTDTLIGIEAVIGTIRNDRFIGDANDNTFDGKGEIARSNRPTSFTGLDGTVYTVNADVVEYSGRRADFVILGNADKFTVSGSGIGTDTLIDIEFVKFSDGLVTVTSLFS